MSIEYNLGGQGRSSPRFFSIENDVRQSILLTKDQLKELSSEIVKDRFLQSRTSYLRLACKTHHIFHQVIESFAKTYARVVSDYSEFNTETILSKYDISVTVCFKGTVASDLFIGKTASGLDLDSVVKFNKIPVNPANPQEVWWFFNDMFSDVVRSILVKGFGDSAKNLVIDDFIQNRCRINDSILITFMGVDFVFPFSQQPINEGPATSTCLNDSLIVMIPTKNGVLQFKSDELILEEASFSSEFNVDFQKIKSAMQDKILIFPAAERVYYNGFERLAYLLTKGHTTLDKGPITVLLSDLYRRCLTPSEQDRRENFPLERFYQFIVKKRLGPNFCLNMFLNAYQTVKAIAEDADNVQAKQLIGLFQFAFSQPMWQELFPIEIRQVTASLDVVLYIKELKTAISIDASETRIARFFDQTVSVSGHIGKEEGFFISKRNDYDKWFGIYCALKLYFSPVLLKKCFQHELEKLDEFGLSFEDSIKILYFNRAIREVTISNSSTSLVLDSSKTNEIAKIFPQVMEIFKNHPLIMRTLDIQQSLHQYIINFPDVTKEINQRFFNLIVDNPFYLNLIPLFYFSLSDPSSFSSQLNKGLSDPKLHLDINLLTDIIQDLSLHLDPSEHLIFIQELMKFDSVKPGKIIRSEKIIPFLENPNLRSTIDLKLWNEFLVKNHSDPSLLDLKKVMMAFCAIPDCISSFCPILLNADLDNVLLRKLFSYVLNSADQVWIKAILLKFPEVFEGIKNNQRIEILLKLNTPSESSSLFLAAFKDSFYSDPSILKRKELKNYLLNLPDKSFFEIFKMVVFLPLSAPLSDFQLFFSDEEYSRKSLELKPDWMKMLDSEHDSAINSKTAALLLDKIIDQETVSSMDDFKIKLAFRCVPFIDVADNNERDVLLKLVPLVSKKILSQKENDSYQKFFQILASKTTALSEKGQSCNDELWNNSVETSWLEGKSFTEVLDECEKKFSSLKLDRIHSELVKNPRLLKYPLLDRLLKLYKHQKNWLVKLKELVFRQGSSEINEKLSFDLYPLLPSNSERYHLIIEYLYFTTSHETFSKWLKDWRLAEFSSAFNFDEFKKMANLIFKSSSEEIKFKFLQLSLAYREIKDTEADTFFGYFQKIQYSQNNNFVPSIIEIIEKLSLENQTAFFEGNQFYHEHKYYNFIEKAKRDFGFITHLIKILEKKEHLKLSPVVLKDHLGVVALAFLDRFSSFVPANKETFIKFIAQYSRFCFNANLEIPQELFLGIVHNLERFKSHYIQILEIICLGSSSHKFSDDEILAFIKKRISLLKNFKKIDRENGLLLNLCKNFSKKNSIKPYLDALKEILNHQLIDQQTIIYELFLPQLLHELSSKRESDIILEHPLAKVACNLDRSKNIIFNHIENKLKGLKQIKGIELRGFDEVLDLFEKIIPIMGPQTKVDDIILKFFDVYIALSPNTNDAVFWMMNIIKQISNIKYEMDSKNVSFNQAMNKKIAELIYNKTMTIPKFKIMDIVVVLEPLLPEIFPEFFKLCLTKQSIKAMDELKELPLQFFLKVIGLFEVHGQNSEFFKENSVELGKLMIERFQDILNIQAFRPLNATEVSTLISALFIYFSVYSSIDFKQHSTLVLDVINTLIEPANIYITDQPTPILLIIIFYKLSPELQKDLLVEAHREKFDLFIRRIFDFIVDLAIQGKSNYKSQQSVIMTYLVAHWMYPLYENNVDIFTPCLFILSKIGMPDLSDVNLRGIFVRGMMQTMLLYLYNLKEDFEVNKPDEEMYRSATFDTILSDPKNAVSDVVLHIKNLILHFMDSGAPIDLDLWNQFPLFVQKLLFMKAFNSQEELPGTFDLLRSSFEIIFKRISLSPVESWFTIWPVLNKYYYIILNQIALKAEIKPKLASEFFSMQRIVMENAIVPYTTRVEKGEFLGPDIKDFYLSTNIQDLEWSISCLIYFTGLKDLDWNRRIKFLQIIFSGLIHLKNQNQSGIIPQTSVDRLHQLGVNHFMALISHYNMMKMPLKNENRMFLLKIAFHLADYIASEKMSDLMPKLLEIILEELKLTPPRADVLYIVCKLILKSGSEKETKQFLNALRNVADLKLLKIGIPEIQSLIDIEEASKVDLK